MRSGRLRYFQVRRDALIHGWQLLLLSILLLISSGAAFGFGTPLIRLAVAPTPTLPPTRPPTASPVPPTATATHTPVPSPTPSATLGPSPTPTDTPTATVSPTPGLPTAVISPIPGATVTPPPNAVAANLRFSERDNCAVTTSTEYFDQLPRTIYGHFYYDNWLPGVQWSGVWLRNGEPFFVETTLWDGSTGGCGFTDDDNGKNWWPEGDYEVQVFIGDRWLVSGRFSIVRTPPTATRTPTRTPRTPTVTSPPTASRTPVSTPTLTPTRTPPMPTATAGATATPSPSPTREGTPLPPGVWALAVIELTGNAHTTVIRETPPDGRVLAFVDEGTPVEVLVESQLIDGVYWRVVRLPNGLTGWIGDYLLRITQTR